MKARLSAKAFQMKISFVYTRLKTDFHNKNFALSLAFIMRFKGTRKWPIDLLMLQNVPTLTRKVANHSSFSARDLMDKIVEIPLRASGGRKNCNQQ